LRIIPKKAKVSLELFKGISLGDFCVAAIGISLATLVLCSNLPWKLYIITGIAVVFILLLLEIDEDKNYVFIGHIIKHFARPHEISSQYSLDARMNKAEEDNWEGNEEDKVEEKQKKQKDKGLWCSRPDSLYGCEG
jgi:hypothetical protein